jgi:cyclohexanecarboxyl-CoA dehydrogenase
MLDFSFTEEQLMLRAMVRDFGIRELAPSYKDRVKAGRFPADLIKKFGELGLMGLNVPEKYGGQLRDAVTVGVVLEELARQADDGSWPVFCSYGAAMMVSLASEEVKQEWLPLLARGEKIFLLGATEADAGSDLSNLKTRACKDGESYIIDGEKNRVTFAMQGQVLIVLAKTGSEGRICPFLVPLDLPGISISPINDLGCESTPGGIVSMDGVRIPQRYLLGDEEGHGFRNMLHTFDSLRVLAALESLAKAEVSLQETIEYARKRIQFGKPISKYQGTSFRLAEAATNIELGRWLCYRALWMKDNGLKHSKESAMVKWWCPRTAFNIIHECLLIHGHYGYSRDLPIEQRLRDSILTEIGDGTAEIMKLIISRDLLGREFVDS